MLLLSKLDYSLTEVIDMDAGCFSRL